MDHVTHLHIYSIAYSILDAVLYLFLFFVTPPHFIHSVNSFYFIKIEWPSIFHSPFMSFLCTEKEKQQQTCYTEIAQAKHRNSKGVHFPFAFCLYSKHCEKIKWKVFFHWKMGGHKIVWMGYRPESEPSANGTGTRWKKETALAHGFYALRESSRSFEWKEEKTHTYPASEESGLAF